MFVGGVCGGGCSWMGVGVHVIVGELFLLVYLYKDILLLVWFCAFEWIDRWIDG